MYSRPVPTMVTAVLAERFACCTTCEQQDDSKVVPENNVIKLSFIITWNPTLVLLINPCIDKAAVKL